ncbi:MAG TPA: cupin domain-containing protein [Candidatus Binataceae bacterium]|nr:cupin domain-containing protein [Candidatus Binataceae bacterium]
MRFKAQVAMLVVSPVMVMFFVVAAARAADPGAGIVHQISRQPLPEKPGMDVVVITVTYPPGGSTPAHEHPGFTYAYVLKGAVISALDNEPPKTYTEGQAWSEQPMQEHRVSKNASQTVPAELLVFFVLPHNATNLVIPLTDK